MLKPDTLAQSLIAAQKRIQNLKPPFAPPAPLMALTVAAEYAKAYDDWVNASSPLAGGVLSIITPGSKDLITASLVSVPLMAGWVPGLIAYWTPVVWAGPGYIPANPTVAAAISGMAAPLAVLFVPPPLFTSQEAFATALATILYTFTLLVTVTGTTAAGVATPLPIL
jgi:hypothetical protein